MKNHPKCDPKMSQKSIKNVPINRYEKNIETRCPGQPQTHGSPGGEVQPASIGGNPAAPHIPPGLPRNTGNVPSCSQSAGPVSNFVDFYTLQKSSKNRIPRNTAKNLKSRTPERQNVDFGVTLGVNFCIDFHEIVEFLIINENHRNAYI